jgi:hypothetical protein
VTPAASEGSPRASDVGGRAHARGGVAFVVLHPPELTNIARMRAGGCFPLFTPPVCRI